MPLTPAQQATLNTNINANTATAPGTSGQISNLPHTQDSAFAVAAWYSLVASPAFTVWKTTVSINEVGDNFVGSDLSGLTTANQGRLQTIAAYSGMGVNPSLADRRAFFDDVFSGAGGTATRAKLLILWKRLAKNVEKLFATGTGSDASPATMTYQGGITQSDVSSVWGI